MRTRHRSLSAVLAVLLLAAACGGGDDPGAEAEPSASETDRELAVAVASFDLAVGDGQRLLTGIYTAERQLLGFGEVTFDLGYLGDEPSGQVELTQSVQASFLPVPGAEPEGDASQPTLLLGTDGAGVYAAEVDFDQPGYWGVRVTAELDDGTVREGEATFPVLAAPEVPAPGDEAPRTDNLTIADVEAGDATFGALDSRAEDVTDVSEIPTPELHRTTIAESIEQGRPVVAAFSTPVYCVSRFCGPLIDTIDDLRERYSDRADFVMVEVWQDFENQELNPAAAEWIQTESGGNEPWTFLIDENGEVADRWDNVLDAAELEAALEALPAIPPLEG